MKQRLLRQLTRMNPLLVTFLIAALLIIFNLPQQWLRKQWRFVETTGAATILSAHNSGSEEVTKDGRNSFWIVWKSTRYRMNSHKHKLPYRANEVLLPSLHHSTSPPGGGGTTDLGALGVVWQSKHHPHEGRRYPQFSSPRRILWNAHCCQGISK